MSLLMILAAATASPAPAPYRPTPSARIVEIVDSARGADRSEVLVLGTAHLNALPAEFDRARLAPLLDRLVRWKPQIIAIEALTGTQCDYLRTFKFAYPDTAETYCPDAGPARTALGLDQAGAEAEIERILAQPAADRPAAERRRLAALFLAAGDPASARVQWWRLPTSERKAEGALNADLVETLNRVGKPNESIDIAAALAVRLGLERVYPVDDHTGDRATGSTDGHFDERLMAIWKAAPGAEAARAQYESAFESVKNGADILTWYRQTNNPATLIAAVRSDFAAAAADREASHVGLRYLAYWETRNLRMVANIREAMGPTPGARVLAIVGASHKPHYERYLGMMSEVRLADVQTVLK